MPSGDDDIFAAIATGLLEGAERGGIPYLERRHQDQLLRGRRAQELEDEFNQYQRRLPLEEASAIRREQAKPHIYFIDPETGLPVSSAPRGSRSLPLSEERKTLERGRGKIKLEFPKAKAALEDNVANLESLEMEVNDILSMPGLRAATGVSAFVSKIPGTAARDAAARIETLKSKTAFNTLQNMRTNSPTGGALGQVSDRENMMLEANVSALDREQTEEGFINSLIRLRNFTKESRLRRQRAFEETYRDVLDERLPVSGSKTVPYESVDDSNVKAGSGLTHGITKTGKTFKVIR